MNNGGNVQFRKLFEPGWIGQMELRNRIVMPPIGTNLACEDGSVSQRTKDYYEARAKGGAGLVIVEASSVEHSLGQPSTLARQLLIDDDRFIPGLSELAQVIHKHGAKAAIQIHHGGREGMPTQSHLQPVAPSPIAPAPVPGIQWGGRLPRELTIEETQELVNRFAQAAERAKKAGFDGVEIHGAHGYLLAQFLSAYSNKRMDKYGGDLKNRARFLLEIISSVKEAVGQTYPVWCRINGREFGLEGGITSDEGQQVARLAQDAGCDAIHVSGYGTGGTRHIPPIGYPVGYFSRLAEGIKEVVEIPVIAVGRITPEFGENLLQQGKADFIAIGRALIADPDLPNKVASGEFEEIRPCLSCNACLDSIHGFHSPDRSLRCTVNAIVGKEREFATYPVERPKKVLIIGGGPAGLEAAGAAALRGHHVVLFEKESDLGGQLHVASLPPYKQSIQSLKTYLARQVEKLGVRIELGKKANVGDVQELNPDVIILATGASPIVPEIPGIKRNNVVFFHDVLMSKVPVGESVIVIGGELVGCETGEFLAEKGKKVTITRRGLEMAADMALAERDLQLARLNSKEVTMLAGVKYGEVVDEGLSIITREGEKRTIEADTIVLAAGARPNIELLEALKDKGYVTHLVGDCIEPRRIMEAVYEGFEVGRAI